MEENLTRTHKLVQEITSKAWFANPAGKQGFEVILLEQVGDGGTRYYHSLKPGETLRLTERLLGKFVAYQVDMRHARAFVVEGQFGSRDRGRKVACKANVRYHVTDARIVAMETVDPLGELYGKVVSSLNRDLRRYSESEITASLIEEIIQNIGPVQHLGLAVEDAEVQDFTEDPQLTQYVLDVEDTRHAINVKSIRQDADIKAKSYEQSADIERRTRLYEAINLSNPNVFMHEHPEMIPQLMESFNQKELKLLDAQVNVVQASIAEYIEQQKRIDGEIDPRKIAQILRDSISPATLQFGQPSEPPRIDWGTVIDADQASGKGRTTAEERDEKEKPEKKPEKDDPRIQFGG